MLKNSLIAKTEPVADKSQIWQNKDVRITYLTSRLIRVESGHFTDDASYAVWFRRFPAGEFKVEEEGRNLLVTTEDITFEIKTEFR
ncbi:MAG: DUF4968 domain-containing protein, partial [Clostridia bacterium]|nr:DUF4968 domain-containing protein [Clostridia bacterium]